MVTMKIAKSAAYAEEQTFSQLEFDFFSGLPISDIAGRVEEFAKFTSVSDDRVGDGLPRDPVGSLSHLIDGWEKVPKYCMTAREQSRRRTVDGKLESVVREFTLAGRCCKMIMHPARLLDEKTQQTIEYFPTPHDQAIEHILIRLFASPDKGEFFSYGDQQKAMLRLRLRDIWRILKAHNMQRNITQIRHSINVLAGTRIQLSTKSGLSYSDTIIGSVTCSSSTGHTIVSFPAIVCCAVWSVKYTQFSFSTYMRLKSPLSRWLLVSMSLTRNLGTDRPFKFSLEDVKQSGLVAAKRSYDQARTCEVAIEELFTAGVIDAFQNSRQTYGKQTYRNDGKMCGACYQLQPSVQLVKNVKAANYRERTKPRSFSALPNAVIADLVK